jgi:NAD(P)-dependent dehydrogenase (short-subunit alcohol dehydrogenase family)
VATRNEEKGKEAAEKLKLSAGMTRSQGTAHFMELNLASLRSVKQFADAFLSMKLPLHILACNGAVWVTKDAMTEDGFEVQLGTYHFGHAYLVELLLPKLQESKPSRVVFTTSGGEAYGEIHWDDFVGAKRKTDFKTYCTSKLYGHIFAKELANRIKGTGVHVYAGQPGMSSTDFFRPGKFDIFKSAPVAQWLMQKVVGLRPAQGAAPIIRCCMEPEDQLNDMTEGVSYGPVYKAMTGYSSKLPEVLRGAPQMQQSSSPSNLYHSQPPENAAAKDDALCRRLYDTTMDIIHAKTATLA